VTDVDNEFLTTKALAARWRCSEQSLKVRRMRHEGPPYIKLGRRTVRYRLKDIEQWESQRSVRDVVIAAAVEYAERAAKPV
jgi:predicted DNA-binding transcriptional regulator AlpA